jgi:hypothetical protein
MTAPRLVARKEVDRVYASLERAFVAECPEHAEMVRLDLTIVPPPRRNTRAFALWDALRLAWSARARFLRRDTTAHAKKRGQRMPLHDDKLRDQAIRSMERSITQAANAARLLAEDAAAMETVARKLRGGRVEGPREDADAAAEAVQHLVEVLGRLRRFRGVPQVRTQREWDVFLSQSAAKFGAVGMATREVVALLTGLPENRVDRAELERFRQRVRRLKLSDTYERTNRKSNSYADFSGA